MHLELWWPDFSRGGRKILHPTGLREMSRLMAQINDQRLPFVLQYMFIMVKKGIILLFKSENVSFLRETTLTWIYLSHSDLFQWFLSTQDDPGGRCCSASSKTTFLFTDMRICDHSVYYFEIRREILLSSDSDLALSALLLSNSFRPGFCLTADIMCKWIFKDLHIYITEFLSLKFSRSAQFCPQYVNFLLVSST